jgi:hypothetical protein
MYRRLLIPVPSAPKNDISACVPDFWKKRFKTTLVRRLIYAVSKYLGLPIPLAIVAFFLVPFIKQIIVADNWTTCRWRTMTL